MLCPLKSGILCSSSHSGLTSTIAAGQYRDDMDRHGSLIHFSFNVPILSVVMFVMLVWVSSRMPNSSMIEKMVTIFADGLSCKDIQRDKSTL